VGSAPAFTLSLGNANFPANSQMLIALVFMCNNKKMKMELIETIKRFDSERIFPDAIENNEFIFYHGTSEFYSNEIEEYGLYPNTKAITNYFYDIIDIAEKIYTHTYGNDEFFDFNNNVRSAIEYFRDFTRISLIGVSICAADYAIGSTAGGQGLRHLRTLKQIISSFNFSQLPNTDFYISEKQTRLFNIENIFNIIKNSNGVVYAFKFDNNDIENLYYDNHGVHSVLLSTKHITAHKLVAKMIIPNNIVISNEILKIGNNKTKSLYNLNPATFIGRIIQNNIERYPIEEN